MVQKSKEDALISKNDQNTYWKSLLTLRAPKTLKMKKCGLWLKMINTGGFTPFSGGFTPRVKPTRYGCKPTWTTLTVHTVSSAKEMHISKYFDNGKVIVQEFIYWIDTRIFGADTLINILCRAICYVLGASSLNFLAILYRMVEIRRWTKTTKLQSKIARIFQLRDNKPWFEISALVWAKFLKKRFKVVSMFSSHP